MSINGKKLSKYVKAEVKFREERRKKKRAAFRKRSLEIAEVVGKEKAEARARLKKEFKAGVKRSAKQFVKAQIKGGKAPKVTYRSPAKSKKREDPAKGWLY